MNLPSTRVSHGLSRPLILLLVLALLLCGMSWVLVWSLVSKNAQAKKPVAEQAPPSPSWESFGIQGLAMGQFQQPRGIAGLPDGSFVVVDRAARVQHFSPGGKPLKLWSMKDHKLGNPKGLTVLPNGNLLLCDTHYGRLLEMSLDGQVVKMWGTPGFDKAQFTHPLSAVVDSARQVVYVVEYGARNDRVQKFKTDGTFLSSWGAFGTEPGQFQRASGITVDGDGNVFVADACNHRIQKFDGDGKLLKSFGHLGRNEGELRYPYDIACGLNRRSSQYPANSGYLPSSPKNLVYRSLQSRGGRRCPQP